MKREMAAVTAIVDLHGYGACAMSPRDSGPEDAVMRLMEHAPNLFQALQRVIHPMADDDDVKDARALLAVIQGRDPDAGEEPLNG